ncbi:MAG: acid phosphatase, partial [Mesorhizobium sp.]
MTGTNVPVSARADGSLLLTSPSQPANVGDAMLAAAHYHDSGDYDRDLAAVAKQAGDWVVKRATEV